MSTPALFTPLKIGNHELKHRVVLAPLTRMRCTDDAVPTDMMREYYSQRATDGGLLIAEATFITRIAGTYPNAPGIYTKEQTSAWKKITDEVHSKGSTMYLQLIHLGRAASAAMNLDNQPVSASDIPIQGLNILGKPQEVPRALTITEINEITGQFRQAALNALEAGFDGIEIHGANGYLIDQFINTSSNNRTDSYGGSIENRSRFALEVVDAIVDAIGAERTSIRFSPWSCFQDMEDETPYETWGYLTESLQAKHPNLSYIHFVEARLSQFTDDNKDTPNTLEPFIKAWKGPFISSGGYSLDNKLAFENAEKHGTLIGFGRQYIANPDLVERLRNGWSSNKYHRPSFYGGDASGYIDYPFYKNE